MSIQRMTVELVEFPVCYKTDRLCITFRTETNWMYNSEYVGEKNNTWSFHSQMNSTYCCGLLQNLNSFFNIDICYWSNLIHIHMIILTCRDAAMKGLDYKLAQKVWQLPELVWFFTHQICQAWVNCSNSRIRTSSNNNTCMDTCSHVLLPCHWHPH